MSWPIERIRSLFPALQRCFRGVPVAHFDGPAGSQVPECVIQAVADYLRDSNCNRGAVFEVGRNSDQLLDEASRVMAMFLGVADSECVVFGANMTTLTMQFARAISRCWKPGDEIIVSRLDHDANVTPWVLAARDAGVVVHHIDLNPGDYTLNLNDYRSKLSERTRLVAVGYASNATGTINPVEEMIRMARSVGALTWIDAVHYAPHGRLHFDELGCDFLVCSAYKFFGPHVGVLSGRRELLEEIRPYKLRPCTEELPGRWMTGTQNHEGIAGTAEAVRYLSSLSGLDLKHDSDGMSKSLDDAFSAIRRHEQSLSLQFLRGAAEIPQLQMIGITDNSQMDHRVATFSFTWRGRRPADVARYLSDQGLFVWHGNHYALPFTEAAGLEPEGTVRAGFLHYNTSEEVDRLLSALRELSGNVVS